MSIRDVAQLAKAATRELRKASALDRRTVLDRLIERLSQSSAEIIHCNTMDLDEHRELSSSVRDRLTLTPSRIEGMIRGIAAIRDQEDVVGQCVSHHVRSDGLDISRVRIPIGLIAMIFESRPNVVVEAAALAIKSGNALILKGGKEAFHTNACLGKIVGDALAPTFPSHAIAVIDSTDREAVHELITMNGIVDVVVPRGGEGLVRMIEAKATVPVIAHAKGLCHLYVHADADIDMAVSIAVNAKAQRPGVCNAMETLLVHRDVPSSFWSQLSTRFRDEHVELRGCPRTLKHIPDAIPATDADWDTEYLERILSIRVVDSIDDAIAHIERYGSHHTEAICARDEKSIFQFSQEVDASCIAINASTRLNDGGELGLGAELGISTSKLHVYGPMGAIDMTIPRWVLRGKGQVRT